MMLISAWSVWTATGSPARAATTAAGAAQVIAPDTKNALNMGGSATSFTLALPTGASCTGDSANGNYRVQSFMVPATVDPATLTYGGNGPVPSGKGASFRQPLFFQPAQSSYVNIQTANQETPNGPGKIINIPTFDFTVWSPGDIPAGPYLLGIACTLGPPSATQLDKFWDVQLVFAVSSSDTPAGVTWMVSTAAPPPTTTTSTTTTTTTTTTTIGGTGTSTTTTSTTVLGDTTTTAGDGSGTAGDTSSTALGDSAGSNSGSAPLAPTGSNALPLVVWALLFIWFGRMALLVGRRTQVRSPDGR